MDPRPNRLERSSIDLTADSYPDLDLDTRHAELLAGSAISPAVAAARGYRTMRSGSEAVSLGFKPYQARIPGLLVPIHNVYGELASYQLRPDKPRLRKDKPIKYETPTGMRMLLDIPPMVQPLLGDPLIPLFITEGGRKADSLVSQGHACIAVIGVCNWRGKNAAGGTTALADWESIALNGRLVYLIFDNDVLTKRSVYEALRRLKAFLKSKKATVRICQLPEGGV